MSKKRATQRRWIVHRSFEPNRLSSTILAQAYEKIVSHQIRVIRFEADQAADQRGRERLSQARRAP